MIYVFVWALFCVWLAKNNAKRIKNEKVIRHWLNGALHIGAAISVACLSKWTHGMALLMVARLVFDCGLNLFRGLSVFYISPRPASKIDQIEKRVVLFLAEKVFSHDEVNRGVELASLSIKGFLFIKIVFLFLL